MERTKHSRLTRTRRSRLRPATGSVSVSQLKPIIKDAETWAHIYINREHDMRARGAHREAAYYEDLICAHQNIAQSLQKLVDGARKRQPTPNDRTEPRLPETGADKPKDKQ